MTMRWAAAALTLAEWGASAVPVSMQSKPNRSVIATSHLDSAMSPKLPTQLQLTRGQLEMPMTIARTTTEMIGDES